MTNTENPTTMTTMTAVGVGTSYEVEIDWHDDETRLCVSSGPASRILQVWDGITADAQRLAGAAMLAAAMAEVEADGSPYCERWVVVRQDETPVELITYRPGKDALRRSSTAARLAADVEAAWAIGARRVEFRAVGADTWHEVRP